MRFFNKKHNSGQTIVEYIIIIVIVAVAAFTIIGLFSDRIRTIISGTISSVSGDVDNGSHAWDHAATAQDDLDTKSTEFMTNIDEHGAGYY
jgi:Flp pilus assembly pilin Flp